MADVNGQNAGFDRVLSMKDIRQADEGYPRAGWDMGVRIVLTFTFTWFAAQMPAAMRSICEY